LKAIKSSDLLIFLLDGEAGLQKEDREILKIIRKAKKQFIAVINKIDDKGSKDNLSDFYKLGIKDFVEISAEHNRNISKLIEEIEEFYINLPEVENSLNEKIPKISIVGKPNAGKSTLINSLSKQNVSIVSEQPGTTRDTIDVIISNKNKKYSFIDTAGLRKKSRISDNVEYYSTSRAIKSIEESNIVILIIDSQYGPTSQDSKICSLIKKNNKGLIIAINKSDLIPSEIKDEKVISEAILKKLTEVNYAHTILISALNSKNVNKIYALIDEINASLNKKVNTNKLNKYLKSLIDKSTAPVNRGRRLKFYYATQTNSDTPSFVLFSNFAKKIPNTYRRFIERAIRNEFSFKGTSIKISFRTSRSE
ncbi:MAG: ribosome biogenesis GTPase Der, partial [Thermodesulfobacteriota bacterium]|nr:ribosome biogenesis GTPase Der [Thermodesulfobacteriota bacterium]